MFFKNAKNIKSAQKSAEVKKNIQDMTDEVIKIWSGENSSVPADTTGSYTGNPIGYDIPEQDGDDL